MSRKVAHPRAEHPLFPFPADDQEIDLSNRDISWIYVHRGKELAPIVFKADDLQEETQIFEHFGGGTYTLRARDEKKARWTANATIHLPGAPRPMVDPNAPPPEPAAPPVMVAPQVDGTSPWVRDMVALGAIFSPVVVSLMNSSAARSQAQTELLVRVIAESRGQAGPDMMPLLTAMITAQMQRNPMAESMGAIQTAMQLVNQGGPQGDGESLESTMGGALGFIEQFNEMKRLQIEAQKQGAPGQAPPAPPPKPAGS